MALRIVKLAIPAMLLIGALAVSAFKYQEYALLREQNQALVQKLDQLRQLEEENQRLRNLAAELRQDSPDRLRDELARLRRENEKARAQVDEWKKLCAENSQLRAELGNAVRPLLSKEDWTYVGYGDPESAAQSSFWAATSSDRNAILESICPEDLANLANLPEEKRAAWLERQERGMGKIPGFQILGQRQISDEQVEVVMNIYPDRPDIENLRLPLKRYGSEWKQWGMTASSQDPGH